MRLAEALAGPTGSMGLPGAGGAEQRRLLLGLGVGALSAGLCAAARWCGGRADRSIAGERALLAQHRRMLEAANAELRAELQALLEEQLSRAPGAAASSPELDVQRSPQLEQTAPGSAESWDREVAQALAAEAAAAAYVSHSESGSPLAKSMAGELEAAQAFEKELEFGMSGLAMRDQQQTAAATIQGWWRRGRHARALRAVLQASAARRRQDERIENAGRSIDTAFGTASPRRTIERPAQIVDADDKEVELEVDGRAYLVDRTSSLVFSLDGCASDPQMIGTWDEAASSVSFIVDDEVETDPIPPQIQEPSGSASVVEAVSDSSPSVSSAAGSSPSPPPVSGPRKSFVTFALQTPHQPEASDEQLDRISRQAKDREAELLGRLAEAHSALERTRAEAAATEAGWRREIGEERISATNQAALALQAREAQAVRQVSELQLRVKAEVDAANRYWRREIGAERISAAKDLALRDQQHTAAATIQGWWRRRHCARILFVLLRASAARRTEDERAESATRAALHAVVDLAADPDGTAALLQRELQQERASNTVLVEETKNCAAAAEEAREALIDRLDQVCAFVLIGAFFVLPQDRHSRLSNSTDNVWCLVPLVGAHGDATSWRGGGAAACNTQARTSGRCEREGTT